MSSKKASAWWYLVPLFFSLLGGIIVYASLRDEDSDMALTALWLGVGTFVFNLLIGSWLWMKLVWGV